MPIYEYECGKCGRFEVMQRITEDALTVCESCGQPVRRLISETSFALKGGGWYKDLYSSKGGSSSTTISPPLNGAKPSGSAEPTKAASSSEPSKSSSGSEPSKSSTGEPKPASSETKKSDSKNAAA